jgi:hypothetical protein
MRTVIIQDREVAFPHLSELHGLCEPITWLWIGLMLLAPLLILAAGGPRAARIIAEQLLTVSSERSVGFWSYRYASALAHNGYRRTVVVSAYAAMLTVTCGGWVWWSSGSGPPSANGVVAVGQNSGVELASLVLLGPAVALLAASVFTILAGGHFAAGLSEPGALTALWTLGGTLGCLFGAGFAPGGAQVLWGASAAVLVVVGAVLAFLPGPQGSLYARVKRACASARREFAAKVHERIIARGTYRARGTTGIVAKVQSLFFVPSTVLRCIRWDEEGMQITWLSGDRERRTWDDVKSVKTAPEYTDGWQGTTITLSDGKCLEIPASGRNYRDLILCVQSHVWSRNEPRSTGPRPAR